MLKTALSATFVLLAGCSSVPAQPTTAACSPTAEANRNLVTSFYTQALVEKQVRVAFERYVSPDFVEHKPDVPSGSRSVVVDFLEKIVKDVPTAKWEILRTAAENDLVFLHARFSPAPNAPPYAIVDIFRLKDCIIVEHWDVVGPPRDDMPNTNSRF